MTNKLLALSAIITGLLAVFWVFSSPTQISIDHLPHFSSEYHLDPKIKFEASDPAIPVLHAGVTVRTKPGGWKYRFVKIKEQFRLANGIFSYQFFAAKRIAELTKWADEIAVDNTTVELREKVNCPVVLIEKITHKNAYSTWQDRLQEYSDLLICHEQSNMHQFRMAQGEYLNKSNMTAQIATDWASIKSVVATSNKSASDKKKLYDVIDQVFLSLLDHTQKDHSLFDPHQSVYNLQKLNEHNESGFFDIYIDVPIELEASSFQLLAKNQLYQAQLLTSNDQSNTLVFHDVKIEPPMQELSIFNTLPQVTNELQKEKISANVTQYTVSSIDTKYIYLLFFNDPDNYQTYNLQNFQPSQIPIFANVYSQSQNNTQFGYVIDPRSLLTSATSFSFDLFYDNDYPTNINPEGLSSLTLQKLLLPNAIFIKVKPLSDLTDKVKLERNRFVLFHITHADQLSTQQLRKIDEQLGKAWVRIRHHYIYLPFCLLASIFVASVIVLVGHQLNLFSKTVRYTSKAYTQARAKLRQVITKKRELPIRSRAFLITCFLSLLFLDFLFHGHSGHTPLVMLILSTYVFARFKGVKLNGFHLSLIFLIGIPLMLMLKLGYLAEVFSYWVYVFILLGFGERCLLHHVHRFADDVADHGVRKDGKESRKLNGESPR